MKKKILFFILTIFVIMFGVGFSFMEYNMFPRINLILAGVGAVGSIILGRKVFRML